VRVSWPGHPGLPKKNIIILNWLILHEWTKIKE
jgi:hypothetical protein